MNGEITTPAHQSDIRLTTCAIIVFVNALGVLLLFHYVSLLHTIVLKDQFTQNTLCHHFHEGDQIITDFYFVVELTL